MYNQLFHKTHGILNRIPKFPKFLAPPSHFHSTSETLNSDAKLGFVIKEFEELQSINGLEDTGGGGGGGGGRKNEEEEEEEEEEITNRNGYSELCSVESKVHISHPWPEWVDLMEHLLKKGYFGRNGYPLAGNEMGTKDSNLIRTACLNFGRDRFDILRYFSRNDIRVVMESGCPSIDRKVVNSGKRLRAHVGMNEGNVCSSCSLRGSCERAYVKAREDEGGRTVDVMRILLTYGLDPVTGSVENKLALNKRVKDYVRKLLTEMVEFSIKELVSDPPKKIPSKRFSSTEHSVQRLQPQTGKIEVPMKQGDWICPKCNFINFAKNIKCLRCDGFFQERLRKLSEDQDHLPLKKGDWLCDICNFLNFAKNTRCLQCKEKPPKRQLNPGEWECESCNYVNFKRNMVCLKCDWKRPKASNYSDTTAKSQHEDKGLHRPYSMNFVRDEDETSSQISVRQERQSQKEVRSCLENNGDEDEDEDGVSPSNRFSDFDDFPIIGGKSYVSQDPQARDKWKEEMSKMRRIVSFERGTHTQLPKKFLGSDGDDDEMADWFGYGKKSKTEKFDATSKPLDKE